MRQRDNWCINDSYICYGRTFFHDLAQLGLEKYYLNHEHLQVKVIRSLVLNQRSHTTSVNYKQNSNYYIIIMIKYMNFFLSLFFKKKKTYNSAKFFCKQKKTWFTPITSPNNLISELNMYQNNYDMKLIEIFEIFMTRNKRVWWSYLACIDLLYKNIGRCPQKCN